MVGLVLFGGLCGSLNNVFVHMSGQNIGNDIRKDCFRKIMTFSFPQVDAFGAGSLVTRVTNDITQVQTFVSQFVRGMIRTSMLMFGSIYCMFRLNRTFGLIVLCAFPLIVGCLAFCMAKANPLFAQLQAQLDAINGIMQEDISGHPHHQGLRPRGLARSCASARQTTRSIKHAAEGAGDLRLYESQSSMR